MKIKLKVLTIISFLLLFSPVIVIAGDGQIDIATLPYTISQSGSYVVTRDITLSTQNTNGITINVSDVTLDLNGHTLKGPGSASGTSGSGVYMGGMRHNITIRNGTLRDWRLYGVYATGARNSQFEALKCSYNGTHGLLVGLNSLVTRNTCSYNLFAGIGVSSSTVTQNTCCSNGTYGIDATTCTIEGNTARYNDSSGILGGDGSLITKNNCLSNAGDGIRVSNNCYVLENNCNGNGRGTGDGAGINITGSDNSIERNLVTDNDRGIDCNPAIGNIIFSNRASGNTTNYDIADSNIFGKIVTIGITIPNPGLEYSNSYANFNF